MHTIIITNPYGYGNTHGNLMHSYKLDEII